MIPDRELPSPPPSCAACGRGAFTLLYPALGDPGRALASPDAFKHTTVDVRDRGPVWRCRACGTGRIWPYPAAPEILARYAAGEDPEYAAEEEHRRRLWRRLLGRLGPAGGRTLLEIGCNMGFFLDEARHAGWTPLGVEPNRWARRHAVERLRLPVVATRDDLPPDARFDAFVLLDVIEHLPDPDRDILALAGRLPPGGECLIATPDLESAAARASGARWYALRQQHAHYFTRRGLRALLARAGCRETGMWWLARTYTLGYWVERLRDYAPAAHRAAAPAAAALGLRDVGVPVALGDQIVVRARKEPACARGR